MPSHNLHHVDKIIDNLRKRGDGESLRLANPLT